MQKPVEKIVADVRKCIDEIALNDADFISGQDNTEMDAIIRSKIIDALRYVHGNADWSLIDSDVVVNLSDVAIDGRLVGRVPLPEDYMRLCYARFSSWPLFLSDPIYWNDKEYALLSDEYATGTWERPKLGMVMYPKRFLELYKARTEDDRIEVGIILEPKILSDGVVNVSPRLEGALTYYIAGLTLLTYSDRHADDLFNQAMVMMGIPQVPSVTE